MPQLTLSDLPETQHVPEKVQALVSEEIEKAIREQEAAATPDTSPGNGASEVPHEQPAKKGKRKTVKAEAKPEGKGSTPKAPRKAKGKSASA